MTQFYLDGSRRRFGVALAGLTPATRDDVWALEGARIQAGGNVSLPGSVRVFRKLVALGLAPARTAEDYANYLLRDAHALWVKPIRLVDGRTQTLAQAQGIVWLTDRARALVADPVGAGKTHMALEWARLRLHHNPNQATVVVCPKSLVPQWVEEARTGTVKRAISVFTDRKEKIVQDGAWPVCITNYEQMKNIPWHDWGGLVIDESHNVKNYKSARTKMALKLAQKASNVLLMTATPFVNGHIDVWTTYLFCQERHQGEFFKWADRYTGAFQTPYGWDFTGSTFAEELLADMQHFMLRRPESEVKHGLPPVIHQKIEVPVLGKTRAKLEEYSSQLIYQALAGNSLDSGDGLSIRQGLRQEAAHHKVPAVAEWIKTHFDGGGGNVLVFSEFRAPLDQLSGLLGDVYRRYHGGLPADEREANKTWFVAADGQPRVLGLTYGMGEQGHNFQSGNVVLFLDLPWTYKVYEQCIGRVHRHGQLHNHVYANKFVTDLPIEDSMADALLRKEDLSAGVERFARSRGLTN